MILDKSALMAIINLDNDARKYAQAIQSSEYTFISAVNFFEISAYVENKFGDAGARELDNLIKKADIKIHEIDAEIADLARDAYRFYGKTKNPSAGLAFGDCFSYALAKYLNSPLLYKGEHFSKTDVASAI